jgi:hypothetical protein
MLYSLACICSVCAILRNWGSNIYLYIRWGSRSGFLAEWMTGTLLGPIGSLGQGHITQKDGEVGHFFGSDSPSFQHTLAVSLA